MLDGADATFLADEAQRHAGKRADNGGPKALLHAEVPPIMTEDLSNEATVGPNALANRRAAPIATGTKS